MFFNIIIINSNEKNNELFCFVSSISLRVKFNFDNLIYILSNKINIFYIYSFLKKIMLSSFIFFVALAANSCYAESDDNSTLLEERQIPNDNPCNCYFKVFKH